MTTVEATTIAAVIIGPITAVVIGLWLEDRRAKRQQQWDTFRMLMRTRGTRLSGEHVGALNLVELEFATEKKVMDAWKSYMEHLDGVKTPFPSDPKIVDGFLTERNSRFTKLLYQIGLSLGFRIEQLDIFKGNYTPQAWVDDEDQARYLRGLFIDLLTSRRALPVMPHNPNPNSGPYPPAPGRGG